MANEVLTTNPLKRRGTIRGLLKIPLRCTIRTILPQEAKFTVLKQKIQDWVLRVWQRCSGAEVSRDQHKKGLSLLFWHQLFVTITKSTRLVFLIRSYYFFIYIQGSPGNLPSPTILPSPSKNPARVPLMSAEPLDPAKWQSQSPKLHAFPLNRFILPGSHNSGSHSISVNEHGIAPFSPVHPLLAPFFERWSKCQTCDIYEQLCAGVRYIDLRVCKHHKKNLELRTEHSVYGESIEVGLNCVKKFVDAHPGEIVILHLNNFRGEGFDTVADHACVIQVLRRIFPDHETSFMPRNEYECSYADLVERGRKIVCVYGNDAVVGAEKEVSLCSACDILCDKWFDAKNTETLFQRITDFIPTMNADTKRITVLQAILSPQPLTTVIGFLIQIPRLFFCFLLSCNYVPRNIAMLAEYVNSRICGFIEEQGDDFRPGVVLIDGLPGQGAKNVINKVIALNGREGTPGEKFV